jgi:hypothetical protein
MTREDEPSVGAQARREERDWDRALCVSALHDALKEAERQRRALSRSLEVAKASKEALDHEVLVLKKQKRGVENARDELESRLSEAQLEIDRLVKVADEACQSACQDPALPPAPAPPASTAPAMPDAVAVAPPHAPARADAGTQTSDSSWAASSPAAISAPPARRTSSGEGGRGSPGEPEVEVIKKGVHSLAEENRLLHEELAALRERLGVAHSELSASSAAGRAEGRRHRQKLKQVCARRILTAFRCKLEGAFRMWLSLVTRRMGGELHKGLKQKERIVECMVGHFREGVLMRTMAGWKRYTARRMLTRRILVRVLGGKRVGLLGSGFRTWQAVVVAARFAQLQSSHMETAAEIRRRMGARLSSVDGRRTLLQAWEAWKQFCQVKRRVKQILLRWNAQRIRRELGVGFSKWKGLSRHVGSVETTMGRVLRRLCHARLHRGFRTWHSAVLALAKGEAEGAQQEAHGRRQSASLRSLSRVLARLQNRSLFKAFRKWQTALWSEDRAELQKQRDIVVRQVLNRLRLGAASKSFNTWREYTQSRKNLRTIVLRIMGGKRVAQMAAAMSTWRAGCSKLGRVEGILSKVLRRFEKRHLSRAVRSWCVFVAEHRVASVGEKRQEAIMLRFLKLWQGRRALGAFHSWQEFVRLRRRFKVLLARMMGGKRLHVKAAAFRTWVRFVERGYIAELEASLAGTMAEVRMPRSSPGSPRETLLTAARGNSEKLVYLTRMSSRLQEDALRSRDLRLVHRHLMAWRGAVQGGKRLRGILRRWLTRRARAAYHDALDRWKAVLADKSRKRLLMNKILSRLASSKLFRGFHTWHLHSHARAELGRVQAETTAQIQRVQAEAAAAVERVQGETASELRRLRAESQGDHRERAVRTMSRFMSRLGQKQLARALRKWTSVVQAAIALEKQHLLLVTRAVQRLKSSLTSRCWNSWVDFIKRRRFARAVLLRIFGDKRQKSLAACLRHWKEQGSAQARAKILMSRTLCKLAHKILSKAMHSWSMYAIKHREAARLSQRRDAVLQRFAKRFQLRSAAAALQGWKEFVSTRRRIRGLVMRLTGGRQAAMLSAGFRTWQMRTKHDLHIEAVLSRVLAKKASRLMAEALQIWRSARAAMVEEDRRNRLLTRFVHHMTGNRMWGYFDTWASYAQRRREARQQLGRTDRILRRYWLRTGFDAWKCHYRALRDGLVAEREENQKKLISSLSVQLEELQGSGREKEEWLDSELEENERLRQALRRTLASTIHLAQAAAMQWRTCLLGTCFRRWDVLRSRKQRAKGSIARCCGRWHHRQLARGFHCFKAAVHQRGTTDRVLRRVLGRLMNRKVAGAFSRWHAALASAKALQARYQAFIRRWQNLTTASAFDTWNGFVGRRQVLTSAFALLVQKRAQMGARDAFRRWCRVVRWQGLATARLQAVVRMMTRRLMARGFRTWVHAVMRLAQTAMVRDRTDLVLARVMDHWRGDAVKSTWRRWKDFVKARVRGRAMMRQVFEKAAYATSASMDRKRVIFVSWRSWVGASRRKRHTIAKSVARLRNLRLAGPFSAWTEFYHERRRLKKQILERLIRAFKGKCDQAFRKWHEGTVALSRRRLERLQIIVLRHDLAVLTRITHRLGFRAWYRCESQHAPPQATEYVIEENGCYSWRSHGHRPCAGADVEADTAVAGRFLYYARSLAQALLSSRTFQSLFSIVAAKIAPLVQDADCLLFFVDEKQREVWTRMGDAPRGEVRFPMDCGIVGQAIARSSTVHIQNARADPCFHAAIDALGLESSGLGCGPMGEGLSGSGSAAPRRPPQPLEVVSTPVISAHGRILAVLHVVRPRPGGEGPVGAPAGFGPRHLLVLQLCSALLSMTIYRLAGVSAPGNSGAFAHEAAAAASSWTAAPRLEEAIRKELARLALDADPDEASDDQGSGSSSVSIPLPSAAHGLGPLVDRLLSTSVQLRKSNSRLRKELRTMSETPTVDSRERHPRSRRRAEEEAAGATSSSREGSTSSSRGWSVQNEDAAGHLDALIQILSRV